MAIFITRYIFFFLFFLFFSIPSESVNINSNFSIFEQLTSNRIDLFRSAFFRQFDLNQDNIVKISEVIKGIRTLNEDKYSIHRHINPLCRTSLDIIDFLDCLISYTRLSSQSRPLSFLSLSLSFEDSMNIYINGCFDIPPDNNTFYKCEDRINQEGLYLCSDPFFRDSCKISCRNCPHFSPLSSKRIQSSTLAHSFTPIIDRNYSNTTRSICRNRPWVKCCQSDYQHKPNMSQIKVMILSDIHIEPWYNCSGPNSKFGVISRFANISEENMFQCETFQEITSCYCNAESDPPIELSIASIDNFLYYEGKGILWFIGDTLTHYLPPKEYFPEEVNSPDMATITSIVTDRFMRYLLRYWHSSEIFYACGNNDGDHDDIFTQGGTLNSTIAYAHVMTEYKIVNNDLGIIYEDRYDQISFFSQTGYYVKKFPFLSTTYVIMLNTNLGSQNTRQNNALTKDLEWIYHLNSHAYILGHHPEVVQSLIPKSDKVVWGTIAGHRHEALMTDQNGYSQAPAMTEWSIGPSGYFSDNEPLKIVEENFIKYFTKVNQIPSEKLFSNVD